MEDMLPLWIRDRTMSICQISDACTVERIPERRWGHHPQSDGTESTVIWG